MHGKLLPLYVTFHHYTVARFKNVYINIIQPLAPFTNKDKLKTPAGFKHR